MDTYELNKYLGAFLGALLVIFVINGIGNELVHPSGPEHAAVAVPESTEATATASAEGEAEKSFAALLAAGDAAKGEKEAKKCAACHTFDKGGANKIGPNLYGVVDRPKASVEGFGYSSAMKEKGGKWTYEDLNHFLAKPKDFVPGTKMTFPGIKKGEDRADVVLYLRQLSDSPPPLPEAPKEAEGKAAKAMAGTGEKAGMAEAKPAKAEGGESLGALLASANEAKGEKIAKKCVACHSFEKGGPNKIGPHLYDVLGRPIGGVEGFSYSSAMKEKGGKWTYEDLDHFLTKPKDFVPGTKMSFPGLSKAGDRADVLLFLRKHSDSPPPLPNP